MTSLVGTINSHFSLPFMKYVHMVGRVGLEPTLPYGPDLQSGEVPTTLYRPILSPLFCGATAVIVDFFYF